MATIKLHLIITLNLYLKMSQNHLNYFILVIKTLNVVHQRNSVLIFIHYFHIPLFPLNELTDLIIFFQDKFILSLQCK